MIQYLLPALIIFSQIPGYHPELLPQPLRDVEVKAELTLSKDGYFIYRYRVFNPQQNNGRITRIDLDIAKTKETAALRNDGLSLNDKCSSIAARMINAGTVIPVGLDHPQNWFCGIGTNGMAGWSASGYENHLLPGKTISGFAMTSYGIPAIKEVTAKPLIVNSVYPNIDENDVDVKELKKVMREDREKVSFRGKTVGPSAPPAIFNATLFLDYIIDLKHQAAALGWITNDGAVKSLDAKLENAKKKIGEGQMGAAKNILGAFISEVEAQGCATYENCPAGKHLTSEAYALLKYNAQYLIDNLSK